MSGKAEGGEGGEGDEGDEDRGAHTGAAAGPELLAPRDGRRRRDAADLADVGRHRGRSRHGQHGHRPREGGEPPRQPERLALHHDPENPYDRAEIRGRVVRFVEGEEAERSMDRLTQKYIGEERYPWLLPGSGA